MADIQGYLAAVAALPPVATPPSAPSRLPPLGEGMRGSFGQLIGSVGGRPVAAILAALAAALPPRVVEFDRAGRGDAVNHDLYGWDAGQNVGIVQVRHTFRRYRNGYTNSRKTYVLAGFNETGTPFRHPVSASAVRGAVRVDGDPVAVVRAAQRWMWKVTDKQLAAGIRQGDVLMVPERRSPPADATVLGGVATLADTHEVSSRQIVRWDGSPFIWAVNPRIRHLRAQHETIRPIEHDGWYSVRVADEEPAWDFSLRLGD
jgi:hypothetical protein